MTAVATHLDRRQLGELAAVVLTTLAHLACFGHDAIRPFYLALAIGGWTTYGLYTAARSREVLTSWGFTRRQLRPAMISTMGLSAVAAVFLLCIGKWLGTFATPWTLFVILAIYPVWGWVQQWLVQGVVARSLADLPRPWSHPATVTLVSATAFGLVHWPYPALMAATFALGLVVTPLYLRYRNLWPLGLAHGWLGGLMYFWVLGRDPLTEMLSAAAWAQL